MTLGGFVRKAALALAALGLFSLVFSLLAERGLWPELPAGALHGTDLAAGFAVGVGLLVFLVRRPAKGPHPAAEPAAVDIPGSPGSSARDSLG